MSALNLIEVLDETIWLDIFKSIKTDSNDQLFNSNAFLQELYDQLHIGAAAGCATGRNIFQHSFKDAVAITKAISAMVYDSKSVDVAMKMYEKHK